MGSLAPLLTHEWGPAQPYQTDDGRARAQNKPPKLFSQIMLHNRSTPDAMHAR